MASKQVADNLCDFMDCCRWTAMHVSILGHRCSQHRPTAQEILRADRYWRLVWWDQLSIGDQEDLTAGKVDGSIVAMRRGLPLPPSSEQLWLVARTTKSIPTMAKRRRERFVALSITDQQDLTTRALATWDDLQPSDLLPSPDDIPDEP